MSLSRNFVYTFVKCITFLQIQYENDFLPTSQHRQGKVRRFLGICLYDCFIYRTNFAFGKCLETRRYLGSGCKTVNRDFKQRERGRRQEPQALRENLNNHLRKPNWLLNHECCPVFCRLLFSLKLKGDFMISLFCQLFCTES